MENRYLKQLIIARTDVDKQVEPFPVSTDSVEKLYRDKLILVFHKHVLKHPEECKTLGKLAAALATKLINQGCEKLLLQTLCQVQQ